ncbi:MAG: hypothetical protein AB7E32_00255 [Desulfovibrio sp.]
MRKLLVNLLMPLASVLLVYLVVEFVFFPFLLDRLPQNLFHFMPRELRVLGQTSKAGLLPRPGYLAIAGDSYAQGKGDWFIRNGYDRNSKFQATHLLHDALGVDCLTFGRSGASSYDGLVLEPLQVYHRLNRIGLKLPQPGVMLLYFYEGNDISDNKNFLDDHMRSESFDQPKTPEQYHEMLELLIKRHADGAPREPGDGLLFGNMILRLLRDRVYYPLTRKIVDPDPLRSPGVINRIVLDSGIMPVPDKLQGPPLDAGPQVLKRGLVMFRQAALTIRDQFPNTRMFIVYVPSPLSCYSWDGDLVSAERLQAPAPKQDVTVLSHSLAATLRTFAEQNGFGFVDTLPALSREAAHTLLHGPRDWDHFNRAGYEAFTEAILNAIGPQLRATTEN